MREVFLISLLFIVVSLSHKTGMDRGYDQGIADMKAIAPIPVVKTTDQQCVAWLFEANMKDVKKRICK
jgi:hypothetical protein